MRTSFTWKGDYPRICVLARSSSIRMHTNLFSTSSATAKIDTHCAWTTVATKTVVSTTRRRHWPWWLRWKQKAISSPCLYWWTPRKTVCLFCFHEQTSAWALQNTRYGWEYNLVSLSLELPFCLFSLSCLSCLRCLMYHFFVVLYHCETVCEIVYMFQTVFYIIYQYVHVYFLLRFVRTVQIKQSLNLSLHPSVCLFTYFLPYAKPTCFFVTICRRLGSTNTLGTQKGNVCVRVSCSPVCHQLCVCLCLCVFLCLCVGHNMYRSHASSAGN